MNQDLPFTKYQITDANDLDDLVIWTRRSCVAEFVRDVGFRRRIQLCLEDVAEAKYFSGPLEHQAAFDPGADDLAAPVSPVVVHISLSSKLSSKAFLYLADTTTEIHLPEQYFITGDPVEDRRRQEYTVGLVEQLGIALGITWSQAEFGGISTILGEENDYWRMYWKCLFARIEFVNLG